MFDWSDYLTLAKQLATNADEASKRAAISRAYYAAFGLARNYVIVDVWQITRTNMRKSVATHNTHCFWLKASLKH
jgi:hypothetical protein